MPKTTALRFRTVEEAVAWLANPPPEQVKFQRQVTTAIAYYRSSRQPHGLRADYEDGARRFKQAALQANLLAFELECEYLRCRHHGSAVDEAKIGGLANKLLPLVRQCHRWSPSNERGADLDSLLNAVDVLGPIAAPPPGATKRLWRYNIANRARGLNRSEVLVVSTSKGTEVPDWWVSDAGRMKTEAINLRRVSFMFDHWAAGERKPKGGRPRDGDDSFLLLFARKENLSLSAVAFLMAASLVLPSHIPRAAVPQGEHRRVVWGRCEREV
jgi:hypothetical protein